MSQTIVGNRMRYAKKCSPEERKSAKFSQAACLDKDSSDTNADAEPTSHRHGRLLSAQEARVACDKFVPCKQALTTTDVLHRLKGTILTV